MPVSETINIQLEQESNHANFMLFNTHAKQIRSAASITGGNAELSLSDLPEDVHRW